jgi:cytochrome c-type biogenesis protein
MSALLIGMAFAFGWTPCIGPILSSVFLLATTTSTIMQGTALLFVFSLGLALPFLSVAFMYAEATRLIEKYRRYTLYIPISSISGILLIILGILLLSGQFGLTTEYGYRLYYFLGFDALFNYF